MWQIVSESVKSANHPLNQDARKYFISKDKEQVIIAVADGHGSKKCFRSDIGSKFAVDVLLKIFSKHLLRKTFDNLQSGFSGMSQDLSLIHISEPTRLGMISYAVFCLKK